ncbi:Aste57867_17143 [Aphanomyces stellatus]|uniref:Aste57867_17143 protein n=1 Tax=Aphanomyces stellatus TaxID=120398 RepID=A0A485L8G1_9STRA|nr:hypothetical protein As57867_017084 [Aphanomyces stellatus]VFT93900.1 Aste57867_17143 [Aphanomyces stellatus]
MKDTASQVNTDIDLALAREKYLAEQEKDNPNASVKFNYAKCLTRDEKKENKARGAGLLRDLLNENCINTIDCLYSLSTTLYELGDYSSSRTYCERLLRIDPTHEKAMDLHRLIKENLAKDSAIGLGLVAGAVVIVGVAVQFFLKSKK